MHIANGIAAMSATHQAFYHRLRFNLGGYTAATEASALGHSVGPTGFSLVVPDHPTATQTMWKSTDLDFWSPVEAVTQIQNGPNITFTAPQPLPEKCFYSVLTETP